MNMLVRVEAGKGREGGRWKGDIVATTADSDVTDESESHRGKSTGLALPGPGTDSCYRLNQGVESGLVCVCVCACACACVCGPCGHVRGHVRRAWVPGWGSEVAGVRIGCDGRRDVHLKGAFARFGVG